MFAGFFALVSTLNADYEAAAVAIGIAVLLDGVDGWVARLANADSDFGLQLDSLADVISFGIAPAILIYSWGLSEFGNFARFSAFVFLICGAMRLARFNVQVQDLKSFAGLPIPAGASFVAATIHFFGDAPASNMFKFYLVGVDLSGGVADDQHDPIPVAQAAQPGAGKVPPVRPDASAGGSSRDPLLSAGLHGPYQRLLGQWSGDPGTSFLQASMGSDRSPAETGSPVGLNSSACPSSHSRDQLALGHSLQRLQELSPTPAV